MSRVIEIAVAYVLPPLLGAIIGYLTNALAIRMLFRPFNEIRVLGIRLPFTPGVIPRQRDRLAHSIARMVSSNLLTEEVLSEKVSSPEFRAGLQASIGRITGDILAGEFRLPDSSLSDVGHGAEDTPELPAGESTEPPAGDSPASAEAAGPDEPLEVADAPEDQPIPADTFGPLLDSVVAGFIRSEGGRDLLRRAATTGLRGILKLEVGRLLPSEDALEHHVCEIIRRLMEGPLPTDIETMIVEWVDRRLEADVSLSAFISDDLIEELPKVIDGLYGPVVSFVLEWSRREDVRAELADRGKTMLRTILDKLTGLQRFFVSAGQYDRVLQERMPEIIADLTKTIEESAATERTRSAVSQAIVGAVRRLRNRTMADALGSLNFDLRSRASAWIRIIISFIRRDDIRDRIAHALTEVLERGRMQSLGEVAHRLIGRDSAELEHDLADALDGIISRPGTAESIVRSLRSGFCGRSGFRIDLPSDTKSHIDAVLADRAVALINRRAGDILATVDVYSLVVDKINSLAIENVEELLLMVIAKHLRYINLFGGLIGAVIGATQILLDLVG